ncbi:13465_t:CDS:2 [Ambispora gerdemannii]|uniref:13465_t:CDS:1 n=1 Tax=Ambispora gerdemannii TaxID=144530 RepID=A0A9N8ZIV7_9GLOM|nr:13465_t:CDS:2 [Ambispora gerdemannii]
MKESSFPDSFEPHKIPEFDLLIFIHFAITFIVIAYPSYRIVAGKFNWELTTKTPAKHYSDLMALFRYGFIVFVLGRYSETFGNPNRWITILSFYIAIFSYGLIAQIPFTKTSLPRWRSWTLAMWILFIAAAAIILVFAGYHIHLADSFEPINEQNKKFVVWYSGCLIIPVLLAIVALMFQKVQNDYDFNNIGDRIYVKYFKRIRKTQIQNINVNVGNENNVTNNNSDTLITQGKTIATHYGSLVNENETTSFPVIPPGPKTKACVHLHHWQIFYVLAFFTRFEDPLSRIASGIVLGIYTQGIAANF